MPDTLSQSGPRILRQAQPFPDWCELRAFTTLHPGAAGVTVICSHPRERILNTRGEVKIVQADQETILAQGAFHELDPQAGPATVTALSEDAEAMHLSGNWTSPLGGCGVFTACDVASPSDKGDPVSYAKTTNVDRHYHDCDEYWIVLEGRATVVVADAFAELTPGDCLCIGMGRHHDMPHAPEPVRAVYFETTLSGAGRTGHLWEHTHGPAVPTEGRE